MSKKKNEPVRLQSLTPPFVRAFTSLQVGSEVYKDDTLFVNSPIKSQRNGTVESVTPEAIIISHTKRGQNERLQKHSWEYRADGSPSVLVSMVDVEFEKRRNSVLSPSPSSLSPSPSPGFTSSGEKKEEALTASGNKRRVIGEKKAAPLEPDQRQHLEKWFNERLENVLYKLKGSDKKKGRLKFVDLKKDYRSWSSQNPDSNVTHVKVNQIRDFMKERAEVVLITKTAYFYGVKFK
jgi:hypothetical protein